MTRQDEADQPLYVIRPSDEGQAVEGAADEPAAQQTSSLASDLAPTLLFVFGMLLMIGILFRLLRKNTARRAEEDNHTPRERLDRIREEAGARSHAHAQIDTFSAEAEELTRRLGAILDNKAARLELLIEEADQRLEKLARAEISPGVRTRPHEPEAHAFRQTPPAPAPVAEPAGDPMHRRICELADEGLEPVQIAQRLEQPIGQVELILNLHKRRA